jgi:tRNA C32,U32 (ribose-2'-O)-methylase TrmJ
LKIIKRDVDIKCLEKALSCFSRSNRKIIMYILNKIKPNIICIKTFLFSVPKTSNIESLCNFIEKNLDKIKTNHDKEKNQVIIMFNLLINQSNLKNYEKDLLGILVKECE